MGIDVVAEDGDRVNVVLRNAKGFRIKTRKPILCRQKEVSQNPKTNSMSPENANSIAIFDTTSISINTTLPPFFRFLCVSLIVRHIALNQSATLYNDPI